jgi:hypothetical protein
MASVRFRELERRLKKLRNRFLPAEFSPTGDYSELQLDRARGYRLLAHAEIEAFLEEKCKNAANSTLTQFRADGRPKLMLLNILSFHLTQKPQLSEQQIKDIFARRTKHSETAATHAVTAYNYVLVTNNGIKEANLLRMILPLGLNPADIDPTWVNTLDTFGSNRGQVAHTSIKTQQQIDPQNELKTMEQILMGLEKLDDLITNLR